jgi:hypothetical protein
MTHNVGDLDQGISYAAIEEGEEDEEDGHHKDDGTNRDGYRENSRRLKHKYSRMAHENRDRYNGK